MKKLKPCPFCAGHMLDISTLTEQVALHPDNGCVIAGLQIKDADGWNYRDRVESERARECRLTTQRVMNQYHLTNGDSLYQEFIRISRLHFND